MRKRVKKRVGEVGGVEVEVDVVVEVDAVVVVMRKRGMTEEEN